MLRRTGIVFVSLRAGVWGGGGERVWGQRWYRGRHN